MARVTRAENDRHTHTPAHAEAGEEPNSAEASSENKGKSWGPSGCLWKRQSQWHRGTCLMRWVVSSWHGLPRDSPSPTRGWTSLSKSSALAQVAGCRQESLGGILRPAGGRQLRLAGHENGSCCLYDLRGGASGGRTTERRLYRGLRGSHNPSPPFPFLLCSHCPPTGLTDWHSLSWKSQLATPGSQAMLSVLRNCASSH